MRPSDRRYRQEIDILRCFAVFGVIFYHFGANVPGGFIGVDVFFVISGYLIGQIVITEIKAGTFHLSKFYAARIRRILPALISMVSILTIFLHFILYPTYLVEYAKSLIASLLFFSNHYFWSETGYFQVGANFSPLLHTWSLAVEEQFYLCFPIIAVFLLKLLPNQFWQITLTFFVLSFGLSVTASVTSPSANFYFLPTRAWELILGIILPQLILF